jgi:hypothetical protein
MGMLAEDMFKSKGAFSPDAIFLGVVNEPLVPTISLGARGFHHLGDTNARAYYLKYHFDRPVFILQKEHQHGGCDGKGNAGYAKKLESGDVPIVQDDTWYGFKFVVRTDGAVAKVEGDIEYIKPIVVHKGYKDDTDGRDGGDWKKIIEFTDDGNWLHEPKREC